MGQVFAEDRIVPTWLAAAKYLLKNGRRARNLVLEIDHPRLLTDEDRRAIAVVDATLRQHCDLSVLTVAGTIFPQGLYRKHGAAGLDKRYLKIMERAKEKGTWGTYAMRLMQRRGREFGETFNPLEQVIFKLKRASTPGQGKPYVSIYEAGVHLAEDLGGEPLLAACEVPTFDSSIDGSMVSNMPCLSHLTFKLSKETKSVDLTAIYRSHYYAQRALGNLVGLTHLLTFVAEQAGLNVGQLTCISTDATLDFQHWGGVPAGKAVLAEIEPRTAAPAKPSAA
jgi:hypothetical protein